MKDEVQGRIATENLAWPKNLHPRTLDMVQRFAVALAKKLRLAEEKYGFGDGWADDHWEKECLAHFHSHIEKGDPRDVAAYCAFMWHHGWITAPLNQWQPIETAPHGLSVLLGWRDWRDGQWCMEVGPATTGQRYENGYSNLSQHGSATHWMQRPTPPEADTRRTDSSESPLPAGFSDPPSSPTPAQSPAGEPEGALGRFKHHPDPAIDFCIEVEVIESEWLNTKIGFTNGTPPLDEIRARLAKAMMFRVGGDEAAVRAKELLRRIEKEIAALLSAPVAEPVATKKVYIKPLRTIVEVQTAYADKLRDLLNTHPPAPAVGAEAELIFDYINYRGEKSSRRARPIRLSFGSSEWHQKPQWLMLAVDLARNEEREFAVADMTNVVGADELPLSGRAVSVGAEEVARAVIERCALKLDDRADYFERAKGHRDWTDAARSYRASAKEIRGLRIKSILAALSIKAGAK